MISTATRHPQKRFASRENEPEGPWNKKKRYNNNSRQRQQRHQKSHHQNQNYHQQQNHYHQQENHYNSYQEAPNGWRRPIPLMDIQLEPVETPKPALNLTDLISKLKQGGYLSSRTPKPTEDEIWGRLKGVSAKSRNQSLIDDLCKKRSDACKFCGQKLDDSDGKSQFYKDHLDEHVRQNLGISKRSTVRQWYPVNCGEDVTTPSEDVQQQPQEDVKSSGLTVKECSVCCEKFNEYYDDDEECWYFKNTVEKNGHVVHRTCEDGIDADMDIITLN